jgi:hypothetical protein
VRAVHLLYQALLVLYCLAAVLPGWQVIGATMSSQQKTTFNTCWLKDKAYRAKLSVQHGQASAALANVMQQHQWRVQDFAEAADKLSIQPRCGTSCRSLAPGSSKPATAPTAPPGRAGSSGSCGSAALEPCGSQPSDAVGSLPWASADLADDMLMQVCCLSRAVLAAVAGGAEGCSAELFLI